MAVPPGLRDALAGHWRELPATRARLSGTLVASAFARQAIEGLSS